MIARKITKQEAEEARKRRAQNRRPKQPVAPTTRLQECLRTKQKQRKNPYKEFNDLFVTAS
jgi:hypothetical protein